MERNKNKDSECRIDDRETIAEDRVEELTRVIRERTDLLEAQLASIIREAKSVQDRTGGYCREETDKIACKGDDSGEDSDISSVSEEDHEKKKRHFKVKCDWPKLLEVLVDGEACGMFHDGTRTFDEPFGSALFPQWLHRMCPIDGSSIGTTVPLPDTGKGGVEGRGGAVDGIVTTIDAMVMKGLCSTAPIETDIKPFMKLIRPFSFTAVIREDASIRTANSDKNERCEDIIVDDCYVNEEDDMSQETTADIGIAAVSTATRVGLKPLVPAEKRKRKQQENSKRSCKGGNSVKTYQTGDQTQTESCYRVPCLSQWKSRYINHRKVIQNRGVQRKVVYKEASDLLVPLVPLTSHPTVEKADNPHHNLSYRQIAALICEHPTMGADVDDNSVCIGVGSGSRIQSTLTSHTTRVGGHSAKDTTATQLYTSLLHMHKTEAAKEREVDQWRHAIQSVQEVEDEDELFYLHDEISSRCTSNSIVSGTPAEQDHKSLFSSSNHEDYSTGSRSYHENMDICDTNVFDLYIGNGALFGPGVAYGHIEDIDGDAAEEVLTMDEAGCLASPHNGDWKDDVFINHDAQEDLAVDSITGDNKRGGSIGTIVVRPDRMFGNHTGSINEDGIEQRRIDQLLSLPIGEIQKRLRVAIGAKTNQIPEEMVPYDISLNSIAHSVLSRCGDIITSRTELLVSIAHRRVVVAAIFLVDSFNQSMLRKYCHTKEPKQRRGSNIDVNNQQITMELCRCPPKTAERDIILRFELSSFPLRRCEFQR